MGRRAIGASATDTQHLLLRDERIPFLTVLAFGAGGALTVAALLLLLATQGNVDDAADIPSLAAQDWVHGPGHDATTPEAEPLSAAQTLAGMTDPQGHPLDLEQLTAQVLDWYGYTPQSGKALQILLLNALAKGQSDVYIDTLLNVAARRGAFEVSPHLRRANGRVDTEGLLAALVRYASG
ncbi:hypothetical protein [Pseudosulfitobacter koreensis]|uniref:Uncharacterized protein n=1 Tax=Pseudosulfitobacter koreensis TaxID=2968472 RepID=A0ABT1YWQ3_9RHOB|nr:hypothetical protein [Pseudosulfitobacter koreense]MCR8825309.1 hypothetical protein [Pseudosulfitobacter koreense]